MDTTQTNKRCEPALHDIICRDCGEICEACANSRVAIAGSYKSELAARTQLH